MSRVISRVSAATLLALCLCTTQVVLAQIAPINSATVSGSVSDSARKPVANAKVSLSGPKNISTQTDAQGLFVFVGIPFGTYQISSAATGLGTATRTLSVTGDTSVAIQYESASQNGLKVIANVSSSTNAQFNVTSTSITQVNPIANAFEGKTSWRTILEQIPGVAQAGLGNARQDNLAALPDGPFIPVQISIDGALPYETATLLDDMPLIGGTWQGAAVPGTGTDLGLYPLNGFSVADVVRGPSASAPSILDSIGGSFVLRAPGMINHNQYEFSTSTDPYGGVVADALAAVRWNRLSVVMTYGVNNSPGPFSSAGIPLGISAGLSPTAINGQPFSCTGLCASGFLTNPNYATASNPYDGWHTGLLGCCANFTTAWSQHGGSLALVYGVSPSISAEVFYAGQLSQMAGVPYQYYATNFTPPASYTGGISGGPQIFSGEAFGSFPIQQASSLIEEKLTAQIGRGMLHIAALQNRTFLTDSFTNPVSVTEQLFGGGSLCSDTSQFCSTGTYSQTAFNGGMYDVTYPAEIFFQSHATNNHDFLLSYATSIGENFHAGGSFVKSYYNEPCQFYFSYNDQVNAFGFNFSSTLPAAVSQTTSELRFFVGGNLAQKISIDLSAYFVNADYHVQDPNDPTGATYTDARYSYAAPRLGFVWRPTTSVAVRASAGGGFAEAPLNDLVGSNAIYLFGPYYREFKTNINLQPEKSFAFDLGMDVRVHRDTVLSFDVYRSNLYGQIYNSTSITGTYLGLPLYTSEYGNLGESRYEGILLDLRHDIQHGLYWSLSGGLTRGYVVSVPAGFYNMATRQNCTNLYVVPGVNFNGTFAASIPYSQALGTIGYRWNTDKYVNLVATYYGNNNSYYRPAFVELDGHVGYPLTKHVSLLATFRNITGIYDGATQIISPSDIELGAPTISGLPYPLYGEEYGPRTILLTGNVHF